jgi:hypothetical protein
VLVQDVQVERLGPPRLSRIGCRLVGVRAVHHGALARIRGVWGHGRFPSLKVLKTMVPLSVQFEITGTFVPFWKQGQKYKQHPFQFFFTLCPIMSSCTSLKTAQVR